MTATTNTDHDAHASLDLALQEAAGMGIELAIVQAMKVTHGARQSTYSHPAINFINTALEWTKDAHDYNEMEHDTCFSPYSVARKMVLLKKARLVSAAHRDGTVDKLGYESCEDRIAIFLLLHGFVEHPAINDERGWENAWKEAMTFFDGWPYEKMYTFYNLVLAKLGAEADRHTEADLIKFEVAKQRWHDLLAFEDRNYQEAVAVE